MSSSIEVEKMKIERSEAEGTSGQLRHSGVRLGSMIKGQNRGVGSHDSIKLLNDENVELVKVTQRSRDLGTSGEWSKHDEST